MMQPYYVDDAVTIYHGEALAILAELESASGDVLLADPPYSSGGMFRADRHATTGAKYGGFSAPNGIRTDWKPIETHADFSGDSRDQRSFAYWSALWLSEAWRIVKPGGLAFVFTDWRQLPAVTDSIQAGGWTWRGIVNWHKGSARPIRGRFRANVEYAVWASNGPLPVHADVYPSSLIDVAPPKEREHATQKPEKVITHLLSVAPCGGVVVDPFMGSGTTLVAAKALGMRAVGVELDERHCETAAKRCAQDVLALTA